MPIISAPTSRGNFGRSGGSPRGAGPTPNDAEGQANRRAVGDVDRFALGSTESRAPSIPRFPHSDAMSPMAPIPARAVVAHPLRSQLMHLRRAFPWATVLLIGACTAPPAKAPAASVRTPPTAAAIGEAAVAAVAAAPWDHDPTGWGALCSADAPCDTLVAEPRIVALPAQAPAFFVPDRRDEAAKLTDY